MSQKILVISGFLLIIIFGGVILANEIQAQTSSITVVSPNGGETWVPGSLFTISWVSVDASNSVGLTLLQNGNHVLGIGTLPNTGKYAWTIPNNLSGSGYSVKVVDMGNNSIYDESNGTFSIGNYTPTIVIASGPSPNQKIIKGSQLNVIWSSQAVGPVKVKIVDEFGTAIYSYSVDVSNSMGDNAIGMVMNYPSGGYYIKVESTSNPAVYAKSSKFFIYESNDITPPSAPTNITVAKNSPSDPSYKLQFSYILPSDIDYYCINIYRNTELLGGILSDKVVSCANKGSVPGGDTGYFPYEDLYIKGKASGTVSFTVKAVDIAGNESINTDKYSYTWSNLPAPNLISPVIGSTITSNSLSLRWASVTNAKAYQYQIIASGGGIVKSQNTDFQSGSTMIVGSNLVNGNYEWKVRACDNLLSVSMPNDSNCGNWSNVWSFKVLAQQADTDIMVISPNGGEKWTKGMYKKITWQGGYTDLKNEIRLIKAENWPTPNPLTGYNYYLIKDANNITNGGLNYFTWIVGDIDCSDCASLKQIIPEGNYIVRIIRYKGAETTYFDDSDTSFSVIARTPSPFLTVLSPNGGEKLVEGQSFTINWEGGPSDDTAIISLLAPTFQPGWVQKIAEVSNSGSYTWTVSFPSAFTALGVDYHGSSIFTIDITLKNNWQYGDSSNASFSIIAPTTQPSITVSNGPNNPAGGTIPKGTMFKSFLETQLTNNTAEDLVLSSITFFAQKEGVYAATSSDILNTTLHDVTIVGAGVQVGGTVNPVDGNLVFSNFSLTIPKGTSKKLMVDGDIGQDTTMRTFRINLAGIGKMVIVGKDSAKRPSITGGAIGNFFTIGSSPSFITVLSPNGGEKWQTGKTYNITWRSKGFDKVRLDVSCENYSIDSIFDVSTSDASGGFYSWTIPATWSDQNNCRAQVSENIQMVFANNVFDMSNASFSIIAPTTQSSITVLSPNGGEEWQVGKTYSIVWKSNELEQVNINLLSADPVNENSYRVARLFSNISASSGNHSWIVPEKTKCLSLPCITLPKHRNHKIEVVDARYGRDSVVSKVYSDTSDAPFNIVSASVIPPHPTDCLPDNTLIKLPNDPKIYIIIDCQKKWIRTVEEFQREGYDWSDVQETNSPVIEAYAEYLETTVNLLRAIGQQKVYRIVNDRRLWVPTISAFNAQGLKWEDIQDKNESEINQYPLIKLLRASGDSKVYYITDSGLKRHIPTAVVFNSYDNKWEDVVEVAETELNVYGNNDLIMIKGDYKVYKLDNGQKRWIRTIEAFNRFGYDWNKVAPVNNIEFNTYVLGEAIE